MEAPIIASMKYSPLSRVESLIRRVVEEPFTWLGSGSIDPFQLASHLVRYYDAPSADGQKPNRFTVFISPQDYDEIGSGRALLERQVADYVVLMATRRGHELKDPPIVQLEPHPQEKARSAHVVAACDVPEDQPQTAIYAAHEDDAGTRDSIRAADAFLIIQGRQHVPLDQPMTRIGRRVDNDIVLDVPSVSRNHAQIRWRQRYFVLYDVSSQGLTFVNGARVQEHVLRPGDVIGLSDVLLVYGEGRDDLSVAEFSSDREEIDSTLLKPEE